MAAVIEKPPSLFELTVAEIPRGNVPFRGVWQQRGNLVTPKDTGRWEMSQILYHFLNRANLCTANSCSWGTAQARAAADSTSSRCGLPRLAGRAGSWFSCGRTCLLSSVGLGVWSSKHISVSLLL